MGCWVHSNGNSSLACQIEILHRKVFPYNKILTQCHHAKPLKPQKSTSKAIHINLPSSKSNQIPKEVKLTVRDFSISEPPSTTDPPSHNRNKLHRFPRLPRNRDIQRPLCNHGHFHHLRLPDVQLLPPLHLKYSNLAWPPIKCPRHDQSDQSSNFPS